jgi:hypothetical protein
MGDKSGAVMTVEQAAKLDRAFAKNDWTPSDVEWFLQDLVLAGVLKIRDGSHVLMPVNPVDTSAQTKYVQGRQEILIPSITHSFNLLVDTTKPLADLIRAGKYNWHNPRITTEHFPFKSNVSQSTKIEIWWPNRYFKDGNAVLAELDKLNQELLSQGASYRYHPAFIEDLLAIGANQSELQRSFPIGALGSIWLDSDCSRYFAYLRRYDSGCDLYLGWLEDGFSGAWRFAVVRKQS